MLSTKLKEAAGNSADATLYVNDVFSTWLYNGLNATQTITTGIDLATKGGLLWLKGRNVGSAYGYGDHELYDSANVGSSSNYLRSDGTDPISAGGTIAATPFTTTGFNLKAGPQVNNRAGDITVAWTFRKAPKFFDVVTYTGTGSARTIAHSLGVAPGMIIVKRTDTTGDWQVYSNGLTSAAYSMQLNLTAAQASAPTVWNSTAPTSSVFSVGTDATVNASGGTYVAYLYAHDTSSTGIIQCGSFTTDGSANATVNLGWEPQYVMTKIISGTDAWYVNDIMRGMTTYNNQNKILYPNLSAVESSGTAGAHPFATGFITSLLPSSTYIYMAIRMPNKPPTTGTQVYNAIARTGTGTDPQSVTSVGFTPDWFLSKQVLSLNNPNSSIVDRLRGRACALKPYDTASELVTTNTTADLISFDMNGVTLGFSYQLALNASGSPYINYFFKRAPGFFDVVCYTGTGVATTQAHNLGAVPELMIVKRRNQSSYWVVYHKDLGANNFIELNGTGGYQTDSTVFGTTPTASVFYIGTNAQTNQSGGTPVAYLFATLAGISKVGSYTGNGTSQNIECGFAAGARFFLVKATSTTGSWWVWDSARGIVAGNDPALQLNSTAAEITTADAVDPYAAGITVNQEATCSINASGVSYVYLAIS